MPIGRSETGLLKMDDDGGSRSISDTRPLRWRRARGSPKVGGNIRTAKGAKWLLILEIVIGAARVRSDCDGIQHQVCDQVRLVELINVRAG